MTSSRSGIIVGVVRAKRPSLCWTAENAVIVVGGGGGGGVGLIVLVIKSHTLTEIK